jgi:Flp pilus assembly protein TadD
MRPESGSCAAMKSRCPGMMGGLPRLLRVAGAAVLVSLLSTSMVAVAADEDDEDEPEPLVEIPEPDEPQLAQARALTFNRTALPAELSGIAKAINDAVEPAARRDAMRLVEAYRANPGALANAAAIAWVQRSPEQALLIAAEAARAAPDDPNALNTLAALLAQSGYEGKAIPLLRYLATIAPEDATVLGNLAVAWLNLGEVEESKKILLRCLALAPGHGTANLAAGIIAESEGRHAEARTNFRRAAESNSSMQARKILKRQRQTFRAPRGFLGMLPKQEYFSPSAFAPVKPQKLLAEHDLKKAERDAYSKELNRLIAAQNKEIEYATAQILSNTMAGREERRSRAYAKLDWENHAKAMDVEGKLELALKRLAARQLAIRTLRVELDRTPTPGAPEDPTPSCVRRRPVAQAALDKMVVEYEKMVDETLYLWRDATNWELTRLRFMLPPSEYRVSFAAQVMVYLGYVERLNAELPLVPDPCAGQDTSRTARFELAPPEAGECPFSIDMNAVVATLHIDCHSFGFDFQAGLAFSVTKEFTSGETTLTAGVGAKMDLSSIGTAGVTGQMVFVWDAGNDLSYVGVEAIAAAKLSGIPGLSGTLAQDTFDLGREPGAESEGPSITATGADLTKDLVKVGADTKLGVTIGPRGCDPSLSGEISGQLLGQDIFAVAIP